MGRIKGSKNKPKETSPEAKEAAAISAHSLANILAHPDVHEAIMAEARTKNVKIAEPVPETPFPDDWSALEKVEKLRWLTQHRK